MNIKEIMEHPAQSCGPDTNLEVVGRMMWERDCGVIPVVDASNRPIGMITDRDIAMGSMLKHQPLWEIPCSEITNSRKVYTCKLDDKLGTVLETMQQQKVRRLPVVNENGELQGIISIDDLVHFTQKSGELAYDKTITTLKAVCKHH